MELAQVAPPARRARLEVWVQPAVQGQREMLEFRVPQDLLEPPVHKAQQVLPEHKDRLVQRDQREPQVLKVPLVRLDPPELPVE